MYLPFGHRRSLGQLPVSQPHASRGAIAQALVRTEPYRGAPHTVQTMYAATNAGRRDPQVRAVVEDVCKGLYAKDYLSEIAAIYYALCRGARYMRDPATVELIKDTPMFLKTRTGDCDDMGQSLKDLTRSSVEAARMAGQISQAGNSADFTTVGFQPSAETHVFVTTPDPRGSGRRVVLDPVAGPTTATMLRRVRNSRRYPGF